MAAHTIDQWMGHEALQAVEEPGFKPDPTREPALIAIDADPRTPAFQEFEAYVKEDD